MTTSQAPVVHNRTIPEGTQYVWTPAYYKPYVGLVRRRAFYKEEDGVFFSYTINDTWTESNNEPEWFNVEMVEGYFVSIDVLIPKILFLLRKKCNALPMLQS